MTPEAFAAANPQVVKAWKEEGSQAERARLLGMYEALKDYDPKMVLTAVVQGKSLSEVQGMVLADMKAKNDELALKLTQNAQLTSPGAPAPAAMPPADPAQQAGKKKKQDLAAQIAGKQPEEQAKILWEQREDLRMEFIDLANFTAYYKAESKAQTYGYEAHRILRGETAIEV